MWQILRIILEGFAYSRWMRWWVAVPFVVIGVVVGVQYVTVRVDAGKRAAAIYAALPETMPGWAAAAPTAKDGAEGHSQFTRAIEKDGKRLRVVLKIGDVVSRKSEEEFLREVAGKPDRIRSVERVAGNVVYLDRWTPASYVGLMFLDHRGLITATVLVPAGQTADRADVLAYLAAIDHRALKEALRD